MKRFSRIRNFILLCLIFFLFIQPTFIPSTTNTSQAKAPDVSIGNCAWMHIDTFFKQTNTQINNFALTLKLGNINSVFILAKNIDGTITYPSDVGIKCYSSDFMGNFIHLMKSNGIKVYFYFPINTDPAWLKYNRQDIAFQAGTKGSKIPVSDPEKKLINLTSKKYRDYIVKLVEEAINKFPIDGIQLDYIRYTNGFFGFSKEELAEATVRKISITKIIDLTYQTFVAPGDWKTILNKYDEGDLDVLAWAKLREDIVYNFTLDVVNSVKNKKIQIGSTLVSSGANEKAYTAIHFGQNWEKMSTILNFVTPMAYHGSREDVKKYIEEICMGASKKIKPSCKIAIGIQANSTSTEKMMDAIQIVKKFNLNFALFRIGTFAFASFDFFPVNKEETTLKLLLHSNVENKQIKGFEIRNTGNILAFSKYPNTCQLRSQNETRCSFNNTKAILFGELSQLEFTVAWNWEKSKTIIAPVIVVGDEKNEFPTLNVAFFSIDQLIFDQSNQKAIYNGQVLNKNTILLENQKTWISINGLNHVLGFTVNYNQQTIEIQHRNIRMVIYQQEEKGFFYLEEESFPIPDKLFFSRPGYFPLKEFMYLFRIHVVYNAQENKVFCSSLTRNVPCSFFGKMNNISALELWISDTTEIVIDLEDFLSTSFYEETFKKHLEGRSLRIILTCEKYSIDESEDIIHLITDDMESCILPEKFCYFIPKNKNRTSIPTNRELLTDDPDIAFELKKLGYSSLLLINKSNSTTKSFPGIVYFDMTDQNITDKINMIQFESKNSKSLFFSLNLKF